MGFNLLSLFFFSFFFLSFQYFFSCSNFLLSFRPFLRDVSLQEIWFLGIGKALASCGENTRQRVSNHSWIRKKGGAEPEFCSLLAALMRAFAFVQFTFLLRSVCLPSLHKGGFPWFSLFTTVYFLLLMSLEGGVLLFVSCNSNLYQQFALLFFSFLVFLFFSSGGFPLLSFPFCSWEIVD